MSNLEDADAAADKLALRWSKLARTRKIVPLGDAQASGADAMYQCMLFELEKVPVPKSLLDTIESKDKKQKVQMHINATLFHTKAPGNGAFFGNTWSGARIDLDDKCLKREKGEAKWNGNPAVLCSLKLSQSESQYAFVFHTKANMADVRLAVELVMTVTDVKGEIRGQEYGICWGILPMEAKMTTAGFSSKKQEGTVDASLFAGTPRLLLFVGADEELLGKKNARLAGAKFKFVSLRHTKAEPAVMDLINPNELVGGGDSVLSVIPGLKDKVGAIEAGSGSLKRGSNCAVVLKDLSVKVADGLSDRIAASLKTTGKSPKFEGLILEIGVHNGHKFVGAPIEVALEKGEQKGLYVFKKDHKIPDYVPHNMVAVVVLVHARVELGNEKGKMCIGWTAIVPTEHTAGPLLVGSIKLHLKVSAPMPCVSNAIVFDVGISKAGAKPPVLTFDLDKDSKEKELKTETFASKVAALSSKVPVAAGGAAAGESDDDEEEKALHSHTPVAHRPEKGKGKEFAAAQQGISRVSSGASAPAAQTKQPAKLDSVKGGDASASKKPKAKMEPDEDGELQLKEFYLSCDASKLKGAANAIMGPYDLDNPPAFSALCSLLEKQFGQPVLFDFQTFEEDGSLGPVNKVQDTTSFEDMLDYIEIDAEGDKPVYEGTLDIRLYSAPPPNKDEAKNPAAAVPVAKPATAPADKVKGKTPAKKEELETIKLHFTKQKITVTLDFDVTWEEALDQIAAAVGRRVYFSWTDLDEVVVVDTAEEFEDLLVELEEDWDEKDPELNGEIDVDIVEVANATGEKSGKLRSSQHHNKAPANTVNTLAGVTPEATPDSLAAGLFSRAAVPAGAEVATWAEAAAATSEAKTKTPAAMFQDPAAPAGAAPTPAPATPAPAPAAAQMSVSAAATAVSGNAAPPPQAAAAVAPSATSAITPAVQPAAAAPAAGPAAVATAPSAPTDEARAPVGQADKKSPGLAPVPPSGGRVPSAEKARPATTPAPPAAARRESTDRQEPVDDDYPESPRLAHSGRPPTGKRPAPRSSASRQMMTTEDSEVDGNFDDGGARGLRPAAGGGGRYAVVGESDDTEGDNDVRYSMAKPLLETRTPLSRALKAQIFTSSIKDLVPHYSKDVPLLESGVTPGIVDYGVEKSDPLHSHLVVLQLLAVKLPQSFKRLYFTMRFFTFEPLQTVPAVVMRKELADKDDEAAVPLHVSPSASSTDTATGICVRFKVDTAVHGSGDKALYFAKYLAARALQIEVWDADAHIPIGSAQVDLRQLLRQGREAVQTAGEYSVTDSSLSLPVDGGGGGGNVRHSFEGAAASVVANTVGSVFLRMVNVGCLSNGPGASDSAGEEGVGPSPEPSLRASGGLATTMGGGSSRIPALTDDLKRGRSTAEGPGGDGAYPARGLAIILAYKTKLVKRIRLDGAKEDAVIVDQLQRSIINERSLSAALNVRQVGALCSYLAQHVAVSADGADIAVDVTKIVMAGEQSVRKNSQMDAVEKDTVLNNSYDLLAPMTVRYGSAHKACENFCESTGVMRLAGLLAMVKDLSELEPSLKLSEKHCASLLCAVAQGGSPSEGVTPAKFDAFFAVNLEGRAVAPAGPAAAAGGVDKKLARWNKMKATRRIEKETVGTAEKDRMLQLEAARLYRSVHRDAKIKEVLESSIRTEHTIEPSFGHVSYFQYTLRNPYSEERIFGIKFSDPELQLVTDVEEWRHLNKTFGHGGVVEKDMLSQDSQFFNVWLQAHQEVNIPFKLRRCSAAPELPSSAPGGAMTVSTEAVLADAPAPGRRTISVSFMARRNGGGDVLVYLLNVHVRPQPMVVDQVFRFAHGENDFLKKRILVHSLASSSTPAGWRQTLGVEQGSWTWLSSEAGPRKHAWSSMESAIVTTSPNANDSRVEEVHLKFRCDKAGQEASFYIVLYNDVYLTSVYEIWQVHISTKHRLDLQGFVGEIERQGCSLTLRAKEGSQAVKAYSSHPAELVVDSSATLQLGTHLSEVPFEYRPLQAGRRDILVNFVDASGASPKPLYSWLVSARAKLPLVSKRYDIRLPIGKPCNKKIMYTNPYGCEKVFRLRTNQPKLLTFRDNVGELAISAKGQQYIGLRFASRRAGGSTEVLVFINDEHDRTEECLCVSIQYS